MAKKADAVAKTSITKSAFRLSLGRAAHTQAVRDVMSQYKGEYVDVAGREGWSNDHQTVVFHVHHDMVPQTMVFHSLTHLWDTPIMGVDFADAPNGGCVVRIKY